MSIGIEALGNERLEPLRLLDMELSKKLPSLAQTHDGRTHGRALALVRLHGSPLGLVPLELPASGLPAGSLAARLSEALGERIARHLQDDNLPARDVLGPDGLQPPSEPGCVLARRRFLENAPPASIVVATRERPASLTGCLRSLVALQYLRFEVVVVDNAPQTDATRAVVATFHDYGTGLTAYLTSTIFDNPRRVFDLLIRAPRGVRYALSPRSPKNMRSHVSFERALIRAERLGMTYGPLAYLISRHRYRESRRSEAFQAPPRRTGRQLMAPAWLPPEEGCSGGRVSRRPVPVAVDVDEAGNNVGKPRGRK